MIVLTMLLAIASSCKKDHDIPTIISKMKNTCF